MVTTETDQPGVEIVSIPVNRNMIRMRDLRDLIEATEDAAESDVVYLLPGELRYEATP